MPLTSAPLSGAARATGLSQEQASQLLAEWGPNELSEQRRISLSGPESSLRFVIR